MLCRIISDLHIEFIRQNYTQIKSLLQTLIPPMEEDENTILLIPGDFGVYKLKEQLSVALGVLSERFKHVYWVAGNHFFYGVDIFGTDLNMNPINIEEDADLLENRSVLIEPNFVIHGSTLWSDVSNSIAYHRYINDYAVINRNDTKRFIVPQDTTNEFNKAKKYLFDELSSHRMLTQIVMTHTAPSYASVHSKYINDLVNPYFVNELSEEILALENPPKLWVHGHCHSSSDYYIGGTRVICNPVGYVHDVNPDYNPNLLIEI